MPIPEPEDFLGEIDMSDLPIPEGFKEFIFKHTSLELDVLWNADHAKWYDLYDGFIAGIAQGRREQDKLLDLIKEAADYLDINEKTYIASTSILHNKFKRAIRRAAGEQDG